MPRIRAQAAIESMVVMAAFAAFLALTLPSAFHYQDALTDKLALTQGVELARRLDGAVQTVSGLGPGSQTRVSVPIASSLELREDHSNGKVIVRVNTKTNSTSGAHYRDVPLPSTLESSMSEPYPAWSASERVASVTVRNDNGIVKLEKS